jgi:uncharacterized membrane protein YqjE
MNSQNQSNSGIIRNFMDAFQLVSDSFMEGVRYRFELFEIELQEVSERYIKMYMLLQVAFFAIFIAFLCLNVLILVLFWEHRIPVSLGLFLFYILAGLFLVRHVMQNVKSAPSPFSATIEVLKQDQVALMSESPVAFDKKANM